MKSFLKLIPAVLILVASCKGDESPAGGTAKPGASATSSTQQSAAAGEKAVIEVNGEKIYQKDLEAAAESLPAQMRGALADESGRRALADEMIRMKLLEQEGRRLGLTKDPEVERQMRLAESNILANAALQKVAPPVSDEELKQLYEKDKSQLEVLKVRQIVVAFKGGALPSRTGRELDDDAARERAVALAARARAGEQFGKIAAAESDDPEAPQSGGAMMLRRGSAPEEVERAVFPLKKGEISQPVKSRFGWHIFQLVERETRPFEELRPTLMQQARRQKLDKTLADLKAKAKVTFDETYFGKPPAATGTATATQ